MKPDTEQLLQDVLRAWNCEMEAKQRKRDQREADRRLEESLRRLGYPKGVGRRR